MAFEISCCAAAEMNGLPSTVNVDVWKIGVGASCCGTFDDVNMNRP